MTIKIVPKDAPNSIDRPKQGGGGVSGTFGPTNGLRAGQVLDEWTIPKDEEVASANGRGVLVGVWCKGALLAKIDAYCKEHSVTRPEAVRRMVEGWK